MTETLADFEASIAWVLDNPPTSDKVQEAILGVIGSIDKPASPAGRAKQHHHDMRFGRTPEILNAFRDRVLAVTASELLRVAETYLTTQNNSLAVVSHNGEETQIQELAEQKNMQVINL